MAIAEKLLSRLEGVRQTGPDKWSAKCPSHDDRSPSLSIRELDDGRVLIHDFAGCSAADVLAAVGLELRDLFPETLARTEPRRPERQPFTALDALRAIASDAVFIAVAAGNIAGGVTLTREEADQVADAGGRILAALDTVGVRP